MTKEQEHKTYYKEKMNQLKIVVIIPTYNNAKTLFQVINQTKEYSNNIIIVNDGSTDETNQILATLTDIEVSTFDRNKGKGSALKHGLLLARSQGFEYAITLDSDGQHFPSDIPLFIDEIEKTPQAILVGERNLNAENMPSKNTFANRFSNFWFRLETGIKLNDTQSGYRLYPLISLSEMKYYTTKYEFELELLVFSAWRGIPIRNIPINIHYPPEGERVSHFRPLRDFTRISILNTFLVIVTFLWIIPRNFFRKLTWNNIRNYVDKEVIHTQESNTRITFAIMLGVFMGIVPIWGYQMIVAVFLAQLLRLNKVLTLVASNISIPIFMPFLLYGSYVTGCIATKSEINVSLTDVSLEGMKTVLYQYLVGSFIFATLCSLFAGLLVRTVLFICRKDRKAVEN